MKKILFVSICAIILGTANVQAQEADKIVGKYLPPEKDSVIEVFKCGDKYCGRTFCIKDNAYPADSKEGVPGTPYLDHHNPDPELKKKPNLGAQFLHNFVFKSEGKYVDGKIYNPRDGKTYCGKMDLDGDTLFLKGHLCIASFLGKTNEWKRVDSSFNFADPRLDCVDKKKK